MCSQISQGERHAVLKRQPSVSGDDGANLSTFAVLLDNPCPSSRAGSDTTKSNYFFHAKTSRMILAFATVVLFSLSISSPLSTPFGSSQKSLKSLTDHIIALSRQLEAGGEVFRELHSLEDQLDDKRIELVWDEQHIKELEDKQKMMSNSFQEAFRSQRHALESYEEKYRELGKATHTVDMELKKELRENAELKEALRLALNDLSQMRKLHPPSEGTGTDIRTNLRGGNERSYQPGDSIEIFNMENGVMSVYPGLISDVVVGPVTKYDVVNVETGILMRALEAEEFRSYQLYPRGSKAVYMISRDRSIPVTIVGFTSQTPKGFEIHGTYEVIFDDDPTQKRNMVSATHLSRSLESSG